MLKYLKTFYPARMVMVALFVACLTCLFSISFTIWSIGGYLPEAFTSIYVTPPCALFCSLLVLLIGDFTVGLGRPSPLIKQKEKLEGYEIVELNGQKGIKCLECNITSYHPEDVNHKYTHCCGKFHQ